MMMSKPIKDVRGAYHLLPLIDSEHVPVAFKIKHLNCDVDANSMGSNYRDRYLKEHSGLIWEVGAPMLSMLVVDKYGLEDFLYYIMGNMGVEAGEFYNKLISEAEEYIKREVDDPKQKLFMGMTEQDDGFKGSLIGRMIIGQAPASGLIKALEKGLERRSPLQLRMELMDLVNDFEAPLENKEEITNLIEELLTANDSADSICCRLAEIVDNLTKETKSENKEETKPSEFTGLDENGNIV